MVRPLRRLLAALALIAIPKVSATYRIRASAFQTAKPNLEGSSPSVS